MGRREVDPRYRPLEARAREVLEADPRVVRVVVTGSIADGTADEWSDSKSGVTARKVRDHLGVEFDWLHG